MSTIRLTLNQTFEQILEKLEEQYQPMSRTEIIKMTVAEFYQSRFGKSTGQTSTTKAKQNSNLIDKMIQTGIAPDLNKDEMEDALSDWWSENKAEIRNFTKK